MTFLRLSCCAAGAVLAACSTNPNGIVVELAPDVISSLDGKLSVHTLLVADRDPVANQAIELALDYTDRNGTAHPMAAIDGKTNQDGVFDAAWTGLLWDGTGVAKATFRSVEGEATFAVLDRTPPKVSITPPPNNQIRTGIVTPITVHVTDEIGVGEVRFQVTAGGIGDVQSTVNASGSADTSLTFDLDADQYAAGTMLMLYGLASDLSGNESAATPVAITVVP